MDLPDCPLECSKALEHAALPDVSPESRRKLLSFVVVRCLADNPAAAALCGLGSSQGGITWALGSAALL